MTDDLTRSNSEIERGRKQPTKKAKPTLADTVQHFESADLTGMTPGQQALFNANKQTALTIAESDRQMNERLDVLDLATELWDRP